LLVLGVVLLGQGAVHGHQLRGTNLQAAVLEAGQDLAGELPPDRIRLDQNESLLGCQSGSSLLSVPTFSARPGLEPLRSPQLRRRRRLDRRLAEGTHLPEGLERRL